MEGSSIEPFYFRGRSNCTKMLINGLGDLGAQAMASMLKENNTLVRLSVSNNGFTDCSAEFLSLALVTNAKLQYLDLSHNILGDTIYFSCNHVMLLQMGYTRGCFLRGKRLFEEKGQSLNHQDTLEGLSENTGLKTLNLAWNCIRGRGAVMLASGLASNIFLRSVDLSFNGFGKEGAVALGQALKENNVLEELNISNNRIPPEGALRLATGLRVNKTIKSLNVGKNPVQNAGCYSLLKSIQANKDSAMEILDLSVSYIAYAFSNTGSLLLYIFTLCLSLFPGHFC
uniref:Leucine rich repeat containing 74B n=1 Tax=Neogobius melanostomus TaxID=47308 RepID=A0A8C6TX41_9GOBI